MRALEIRTIIIYIKKLPRVIHQLPLCPHSEFPTISWQRKRQIGLGLQMVQHYIQATPKLVECCDCCCFVVIVVVVDVWLQREKGWYMILVVGGRKQKRQGSFRRPRPVHLKRITDFGYLKEKYTGTQEESAKMIRRDPGVSGRSSGSVCTKYKSYFIICFWI